MIKGFLVGIAVTLLAGVAVWLGTAYTGAYNVAASDTHADPVRWTLDTMMHRSVAARASDVELPDSVSDDRIAAGAAHYSESCAHCHGAPGEEPSEWLRGMRPEPPHLVEAAADWTPAEIHWIVENGIKMTGMPAFGSHHQDQEIVAISAFVTQLPGLAADDYRAMIGDHGDGTDAADPATASTTAGASSPLQD